MLGKDHVTLKQPSVCVLHLRARFHLFGFNSRELTRSLYWTSNQSSPSQQWPRCRRVERTTLTDSTDAHRRPNVRLNFIMKLCNRVNFVTCKYRSFHIYIYKFFYVISLKINWHLVFYLLLYFNNLNRIIYAL